MAKNTTIRIRAIKQSDLDTILALIDESSKGVVILDSHDTRELAPSEELHLKSNPKLIVSDDNSFRKFTTNVNTALKYWKKGYSVEYAHNGQPVFGAGHYPGEEID